jgi:hypothetical protein
MSLTTRLYVRCGPASWFLTRRSVSRSPAVETATGTRASTVPAVADRPFARLPDEVTLTRDELAIVLFALDVVEQAEVSSDDRVRVRRGVRLLTSSVGC